MHNWTERSPDKYHWSRFYILQTPRLPKVIWKQAASPPLVVDSLIATAQNRSTYLPCGTNMHVHIIHDSLGSLHSPSKRQIDLFGRFCMDDAILSLQWKCAPLFFQKFAPYPGWSGSLSNTRFLRPTRPTISNGFSIQSAVFPQYTLIADGPTDRTNTEIKNLYQQAAYAILCATRLKKVVLYFLSVGLLPVFHRRTRASYVSNVCLAWYNVVLTPRIHSSVKFVGLPLATRATVE